jgi:phosphate transport system protein
MAQTRGTLDKELGKIQDKVLQLGSLLEEAIRTSIAALRDRDVELARQVVANDVRLNELRYSIEELCLTVIATQQPVASDLRMIIAAMHVAIEMERMGDHAEGIAHLVIRMGGEPLLKPLIDIPRMADIACEMLRSSLNAFLSHDTAAARAAANRDDEIDQLYEQVMRELLTYMLQDPTTINRGTYLLWVAHNLERIGDRVTNISERVVFLNTGKFRELSGTWQRDEPPA